MHFNFLKQKKTGYRIPDFTIIDIRIRAEYPNYKPGTRSEIPNFDKSGELSVF